MRTKSRRCISVKSALVQMVIVRLVGSSKVALRSLSLVALMLTGASLQVTETSHASNNIEFADSLSHGIKVATAGTWSIYVNRVRKECFAYDEYRDQEDGFSLPFWIGKNSTRDAGFLAVGSETWSFLNIDNSHDVKLRFFNKKGEEYANWKGRGDAHLFNRLPVLSLEDVPGSLIDDVANAFTVEFEIDNDERIQFSLNGTKKAISKLSMCNARLYSGDLEIDYTSFGASQRNIDAGLARDLGVNDTLGVILENINPDSPAGRAGLKAFDIVREIDERKVPNLDFFVRLRSTIKPGQCVEFKILRAGEEKTLGVVFGDFREPQRYLQAGPLSSCADADIANKRTGQNKEELLNPESGDQDYSTKSEE